MNTEELELIGLCDEYDYLLRLHQERQELKKRMRETMEFLEEKYSFLKPLEKEHSVRSFYGDVQRILNLIRQEAGELYFKQRKLK